VSDRTIQTANVSIDYLHTAYLLMKQHGDHRSAVVPGNIYRHQSDKYSVMVLTVNHETGWAFTVNLAELENPESKVFKRVAEHLHDDFKRSFRTPVQDEDRNRVIELT